MSGRFRSLHLNADTGDVTTPQVQSKSVYRYRAFWIQSIKIVVMLPILKRRPRKMKASYTGELTHQIVVPKGPKGQPGYRILAASESPYAGAFAADKTRSDFRVFLDNEGSTLGAVCFGTSRERGTPEEMARPSWEHPSARRGMETVAENRYESFAAFDAIRAAKAVGRDRLLIDWFFERDGWAFAVGVLANTRKIASAELAAREVLATWRWERD